MVIILDDQEAVSPAGKPEAGPIPVAPVVEWVIGSIAVLKQTEGLTDEGLETPKAGLTVKEPEAFTIPQPPVSGIE